MNRRTILSLLVVGLMLAFTLSTALATTFDPVNRTASTGTIFVDWSETNPEAITDIRWNGSSNLTNSATVAGCPDKLEFFGNSWVSQGEGTPGFIFQSLVGWGTSGTWDTKGNAVQIGSSSTGCPGSAGIDVETAYRFWDHGPVANRIQVQRKFDFGTTAYPYNIRPYMPRLYPSDAYTQVIHPDASGTVILTENSLSCDFGCRVDNWDESWYAIHNPTTGQGLIVKRGSSGISAALWVDQDGASFTNASSALLISPAGGFTGRVTETTFLCFYDGSTWSPSLSLPPGC